MCQDGGVLRQRLLQAQRDGVPGRAVRALSTGRNLLRALSTRRNVLREPAGFWGGPICCPSGTQCCGLGDGEQHCCLPGTECCDIQGAVQAICIPTGTTCCGAPGLESRSCPPAAPVCCTDLPTGVFARAYCCRSGAECCEGACCGPGTYCCRVPSPDATGNDTACCFLGQTCGVIDGIFRCTAP
jgi:hypothetical protein